MKRGLASTEWLAANLSAPDLRVVDASWHLPNAGRDAAAEYREQHIPGAVFFELDDISDDASDLPHMMPPAEKFASRVRNLGLGDGNRIVIYDSAGIYSAARAWWMFRFHGHDEVAVLNGGLPKWLAEGRPIDDMPPVPRTRHFTPRLNWLLLRNADQVAQASVRGGEQIVDARSGARFRGEAEEPRPGLRRGHIPGARNLPYDRVLCSDGTMRSVDALRNEFKSAGVDLSRPVITSCGSGVTAAVLNLALHQLDHVAHSLYDGSWSEWGGNETRPVER